MKVSEVLEKARGLVENGWCQHADAEDIDGISRPVGHPQAVRFCMFGAVEACGGLGKAFDHLGIVIAERNRGQSDIADFNDACGRSHAEVLEVFDAAIALAMEEENAN